MYEYFTHFYKPVVSMSNILISIIYLIIYYYPIACQQKWHIFLLSSPDGLFLDVLVDRDSAGSCVLLSRRSGIESRLYSVPQISAIFCVALHVHQYKCVLLVVLDDFRDRVEALKERTQGEISISSENNGI